MTHVGRHVCCRNLALNTASEKIDLHGQKVAEARDMLVDLLAPHIKYKHKRECSVTCCAISSNSREPGTTREALIDLLTPRIKCKHKREFAFSNLLLALSLSNASVGIFTLEAGASASTCVPPMSMLQPAPHVLSQHE